MKFQPPGLARTLRAAALPLTIAACGLLAAPSLAATAPRPQNVGLSTLLQGARGASDHLVAHYDVDAGPGFVFDVTAPKPLLRFDGSVEIWVLTANQGPRGDTIYKNDSGKIMLRTARIGGMTVYPPHDSKGMAADFDRATDRIGVDITAGETFSIRTQRSSIALKRSLPNLDEVDFSNEIPLNKIVLWLPLLVDAGNVLAETLDRLSNDPKQSKTIERIRNIKVAFADTPAVKFDNGLLLMQLAALKGLEGRPSSERIEAALGIR